jgi:hypothetical protein
MMRLFQKYVLMVKMKYIRPLPSSVAVSRDQCCEAASFYAAPALDKNFDVAPAPTILYSKGKFLKRTKV